MSKLNVPPPPSTTHLSSHQGISYFPLTRLSSPCGRLTLDPFVLADVQSLYDISHVPFTGHANAHPYFGGLPHHLDTPENCLFTIRTNTSPDGVTKLAGGPVVIGMIGYIATVPGHLRTEMGHVWYDTRYRGTFVGKAAPATLLKWAFEELGFRRVEWKCDERNKASRGAAESIGFQFEGTFRKHMVVRDGFARTSWYLAMTDDDWHDSVKLKLWTKLGRDLADSSV
ncbi:acyl-CoA N-acyltransferase [Catenaria anguillulae PL171]|uniref:Acyl-CoA N-acyltransferase n=1 Tax=Catenaria anguillulae PL171 TaxID=765915 RepID=A0A1Y2H9Z8_9FUNG|nr:acyl-CoA N-acyltransferase [Catenaria anguillulae PL171]